MTYKAKCANCGKAIELKRKGRFCGPKCKMELWEREHPRQKLMVGSSFTMEFQKHRYRVQIMEEIIA